jgi:hypothetical protein
VSRPIEEFKRTLESVAAIANAQLIGDSATVVTGISDHLPVRVRIL